MELKKEGFLKQTSIFLQNKDYQMAYDLAIEYLPRFPEDAIAHYMLAKAAFWLGKYREASLEARKAFNLSTTEDDMYAAAILTACAFYELGEFQKGSEILGVMEKKRDSEDLKMLQFIFSIAMKDDEEALKHADDLLRLNAKVATEFLARFLK